MGPEFDLATGIKWYLVFLFSTVLHEAAHAWAALKLGDDTAYRGGQVTLDPTPHIKREPFGMVLVPILSYLAAGWMIGWASAPYNVAWALRYPKRSALMALAGPAANLALVLVAAAGIHIGIAAGVFHVPDRFNWLQITLAAGDGIFPFLATILSLTFSLNLLLCVFNLLPFPPLDGSSLILFFLSHSAAEKYAEFIRNPGFAFFGLFVGWKLFAFIYPPIQSAAVNLLYWGR